MEQHKNTLTERKVRCEGRIKQCELQAMWWIAAATTGTAANRTIHKGGLDGPLMTREELIADAMETAQRHMHARDEAVENYCELIREEKRLLILAEGGRRA